MLFIKKMYLLSLLCTVFSYAVLTAMEVQNPPVNFAQLTQDLDRELERLVQTQQHLRFMAVRPPEGWLSYNNLDRINQKKTFKCHPFAQGKLFPVGTTLIIVGDIHGNDPALRMILGHSHQHQNPHYVFLGDYPDKGKHVWDDSDDTLVYKGGLNFYNDHPATVTLLRGNHEDIRALYRFESFRENDCIFRENPSIMRFKIATSYEFLPVAFLVGCRNTQTGRTACIQFSHGGIEPTYNPQSLMRTIAAHQEMVCQFLTNPTIPEPRQTWDTRNGLLWNGFCRDANDHQDTAHQSTLHGFNSATRYLEQASFTSEQSRIDLLGCFGGHQHYGETLADMEAHGGLSCLWGGRVHTLVSAYRELHCIAYCTIVLAPNPEDWVLTCYTHRPGTDAPGHFNITHHGPVFEYLHAP